VDLCDPTRAITPTLDGPVLAVLAQAGRPLTVGEIAGRAARGSEIGIRRSVARLVEQGIVTATQMGRNQVHQLNREHVAAPAAELLAGLRLELWKRLRETIRGWRPRPIYACVFGSAARGDGDSESDIDLLVVHPPLPGETAPGRQPAKQNIPPWAAGLEWTPMVLSKAKANAWRSQVDRLHEEVRQWTGNSLQVVDVSYWDWVGGMASDAALFAEIQRDAVPLIGDPREVAATT
jgi:hypothetical protein